MGPNGKHVVPVSLKRERCSALCIALRRRHSAACVPLLLRAGAPLLQTGLCCVSSYGKECTPFTHCYGRAQRMDVLLAASDAAAAQQYQPAEAAAVAPPPASGALARERRAEAERLFASHCGEAERSAILRWREADAAVRARILPLLRHADTPCCFGRRG